MTDDHDPFDEFLGEVHKRAGEIHKALAGQNVRLFCLSLINRGKRDVGHLIHDSKSVADWREDIRAFLGDSERTEEDGWADDAVFNGLMSHLRALGYSQVGDVVADVFEGRITNSRAKLDHNPAHEKQSDGFGGFGWECARHTK